MIPLLVPVCVANREVLLFRFGTEERKLLGLCGFEGMGTGGGEPVSCIIRT